MYKLPNGAFPLVLIIGKFRNVRFVGSLVLNIHTTFLDDDVITVMSADNRTQSICVLFSPLVFLVNVNHAVILDCLLFAELKLIAESREALAKSQMKFIDERCRRVQERVRRYTAVRSLKKEITQQKARDERKIQGLQKCREQMQRFVYWFITPALCRSQLRGLVAAPVCSR